MSFGWAGAAAGGQDALAEMLARKRAAYLQQQQAERQARLDQENAQYRDATLGLQQKQFDADQTDRQSQRKLETAKIALSQIRPGEEVAPDVASQIQGTPYAGRLETKQTLPSSTIPGFGGATQTDAGGRSFVNLKPTAEQEQAQGQEAAKRRVVELFKRGAPRNEMLGAMADAGENIGTAALTDPAAEKQTEHGYRLEEIAATGKNSERTARIAANARGEDVVKVEHKDPATGKTVIEYLPKSEVRGKSYDKGTSATVANRLASAQAVNQTGEDIIGKLSDPAYAQQVGVAMGRYNSVRAFIGNPPPEFAELAGLIESYSLANMGVHGMRSSQGAEMIKQLLDQPQTPASIIAAIRGLNQFSTHFMENEGMPPAAKSSGGGSSFRVVGKR